jgi:hypothetical protein
MAANKADYWGKIVYADGPTTLEDFIEHDDRLRKLSPVVNHRLFYCNALRDDYHGQALLEPHVLLNDLVGIVNDRPEENYPYRYFRPLPVR